MYVSARRRPRWSGRRNVIRRPCPWRQLAACEYRGLASAPHHNVGRILWLTQQENFASVSSTAHRSGFSTPKLRKLHSKSSMKRSRGYAGDGRRSRLANAGSASATWEVGTAIVTISVALPFLGLMRTENPMIA